MSILRESGSMCRVCCDICGAEFDDEFHERQFGAMIEAAKSAGWQVFHTGSEWEHRCPADVESGIDRAKRVLGVTISRPGHR